MSPRRFLVAPALLLLAWGSLPAREAAEPTPTWWFGLAGAANLNVYGGTTQQLNPRTTTLTPFHEGFGVGAYAAPTLEYRPHPVWGAILQVGYDDRRGRFDDMPCPCGEEGRLAARPAYFSLEPSLRYAPFGGGFHVFAGPRLALLAPWGDPRGFTYERVGVSTAEGEFSRMRGAVFSGQIGAGHDFAWMPRGSRTRLAVSPFVAYHPRFGQPPRENEGLVDRWALETVRIGAVLKFGRVAPSAPPPPRVGFSVRAPANVVAWRRIHETFPLRDHVFFDEGDTALAPRYARLTALQARDFREEQLQDSFPARPTGRSARQIAVYRHILNIMGDRLRRNPGAALSLTGVSAHGPGHGRARAEAVKHYLVEAFGIEAARIAVRGAEPAVIAPGKRSREELAMLRAENERVEISSASAALLVQIGEGEHFMLKPVEIRGQTPGTDSVIFMAPGAEKLASWSLEIADLPEGGGEVASGPAAPRRFGPFTGNRRSLPASLLLAERPAAAFRAVLLGETTPGSSGRGGGATGAAAPLRREASFRLSRRREGVHQTTRFGILFDIDQARAVSAYDRFLADVVAARIPDSATVFVRGRTDVVGLTEHNLRLSRGRAEGVRRTLDSAAARAGRRGVTYRASWSGEDPRQAPFANATPEERAYNRTVIIDILPE